MQRAFLQYKLRHTAMKITALTSSATYLQLGALAVKSTSSPLYHLCEIFKTLTISI